MKGKNTRGKYADVISFDLQFKTQRSNAHRMQGSPFKM